MIKNYTCDSCGVTMKEPVIQNVKNQHFCSRECADNIIIEDE